ncbi:MAG: winged helix-turn-helix domain-containing protein [Candidatus Nanohaloarchaea archaeon]
MKIDLAVFRALSSPTRIEILSAAMDGNRTTTDISDEVGKAKSTVSSHLEKLESAGLLDKTDEEGRRRVEYEPTRKARTILDGRKRKVRFSLATGFSALVLGGGSVFGVAGGTSLASADVARQSAGSYQLSEKAADSAGSMSAEAASIGSIVPEPELIVLIAGIGLIAVAGVAFAYGYMMSQLGK